MKLKLFVGNDDFKYLEKDNYIYKLNCNKEESDKYVLDDFKEKLLYIDGLTVNNEKGIPKIYHIEYIDRESNILKIGEGKIKNDKIIFKSLNIKSIDSKEKQKKQEIQNKLKIEKNKEKLKIENQKFLSKINNNDLSF